jgi:hypothetical protein
MAITTQIGREWILKTALDNASVDVMLYLDDTDAIGIDDDLADITTEPAEALGNYERQSASLETIRDGENFWRARTKALVTFDVEGESVSVDHYGIIATFTSVEASDVGDTAHLIVTGALSETRDLSAFEILGLEAGKVGFELGSIDELSS